VCMLLQCVYVVAVCICCCSVCMLLQCVYVVAVCCSVVRQGCGVVE